MILTKLWLCGFLKRSSSLWAISFAKLDVLVPWKHKTRKCLDQNPSFFWESFDRTPWRFWVQGGRVSPPHRAVETRPVPDVFRTPAGQFGKLLQMLRPTWEDRTATSPNDQRYFAIHCLSDCFFLCVFLFYNLPLVCQTVLCAERHR